MIARAIVLLVAAAAPAALAQSAQTCPWLTAGTAAKILGAEVAVIAHADSNWSGACRFTSVNDSASRIEIEVGAKEKEGCGSKATSTPLIALGNEAKFCSYRDDSGREVETVTGRVRKAWFSVSLAMPPADSKSSQTSTYSPSSSNIEFLGEQVTGNLY